MDMVNQPALALMHGLAFSPDAPHALCMTAYYQSHTQEVVCIVAKGDLAQRLREVLAEYTDMTIVGMTSRHGPQ